MKNKNVDKEHMEHPGLSPDVTPAVEKQFVFMFAVLSRCAIFNILKKQTKLCFQKYLWVFSCLLGWFFVLLEL